MSLVAAATEHPSYSVPTVKDFVYLKHGKLQHKQTHKYLNIKNKKLGMSILTAFLTNDSVILFLSDSTLSTTSTFPAGFKKHSV